jgi:phosphatidylcholine synthase
MGLALFVDGVDGSLARFVKVEEALPNIDGTTLDNVIDMFNYTVLPVLMIYWYSMVPYNLVYITCIVILLVSCYTFSDKKMKTSDFYFSGFSAFWNLLVLFLYILDLGLWLNLISIGICVLLTFIPVKIVHPLRVKSLRKSSIFFLSIWSLCTLFLLIEKENQGSAGLTQSIYWVWLATSGFFVLVSLLRTLKQNKS